MKVSITIRYNDGWFWVNDNVTGGGGPMATPQEALVAALLHQQQVFEREAQAFLDRTREMSQAVNTLKALLSEG